jgi:hypothetical protein
MVVKSASLLRLRGALADDAVFDKAMETLSSMWEV